ncbi:MAG: hypothetical protein D6675_11195 [Gemmatimonadetes bacterium]|nr:MAG: hypothetical protein D6675_11195 [Gemmatimonadota bacterium]
MRRSLIICWSCALLLISLNWVHADQRSYVWTYPYISTEPGHAELEHYYTTTTPNLDQPEGTTTTEHQFEVEIGMNERFDVAIYQVFKQAPDDALKYNGYKLRCRYRLGERGKWFIDPQLYAEYKGKSDFHEHELEGKLILARDFDRWNIALNPVFEAEWEDSEWETETKLNAGISYHPTKLLAVGMELQTSEDATYLGPTISHGEDGLWVALGSAFAAGDVEEGAAEFKLRMILGVGIH